MSTAWLKNRFTDLKYFIWLAKNRRCWKNSKHSLVPFVKYWILYSIPRLVLGREKAPVTSRNIISRFQDKNLIIPLPISSTNTYWIGLRDSGDFDTFREVCINDHYNYSRIEPGMTVVDVGAHIGTFTLLASKRVGEEGKVIVIEPEIYNFKQLNKNLELNEIRNTIPVKTALSDFNGNKDFFIDKESTCSSFTLKPDRQIINKLIIKVKTLDNLLQEINIDKIDFLKIDTEGAELEILKGAKQTMIKNPQIKMAIAAYHYSEEKEEVFQYLKNLKFSPSISGDLVVVE